MIHSIPINISNNLNLPTITMKETNSQTEKNKFRQWNISQSFFCYHWFKWCSYNNIICNKYRSNSPCSFCICRSIFLQVFYYSMQKSSLFRFLGMMTFARTEWTFVRYFNWPQIRVFSLITVVSDDIFWALNSLLRLWNGIFLEKTFESVYLLLIDLINIHSFYL